MAENDLSITNQYDTDRHSKCQVKTVEYLEARGTGRY